MSQPVSKPEHDAEQAAAWLARASGCARHMFTVVLGSGWGPAAQAFGPARWQDRAAAVPGVSAPVAPGHLGTVASVDLGGTAGLLWAGRSHRFEGLSDRTITLPVRASTATGCQVLVLCNASGGLSHMTHPGDVAVITDHLDLSGRPQLGQPQLGQRGGNRGPVWDVELSEALLELAGAPEHRAVRLSRAVYGYLPGPQYQTPAETRLLRRLGADIVGMSTVPEALAGHGCGMAVLGVSIVTTTEPVREGEAVAGNDPDAVIAAAEFAAGAVGAMLSHLLRANAPRWDSDTQDLSQQNKTRPTRPETKEDQRYEH